MLVDESKAYRQDAGTCCGETRLLKGKIKQELLSRGKKKLLEARGRMVKDQDISGLV